jgi:CHC2 zinc finger
MNFQNNNRLDKARAVRIEDEIARRGIILRGKNERCGPCPVCGGDDRFSINVSKQVFNCRGCNVGGDVIALVQHLDGCDFITAATTLAGPKPNAKKKAEPMTEITVASFGYENEDGTTAYTIKRIEFQKPDGTFVLKDGKRRKAFKLDPAGCTVRIPYRLPQLVEAVASEHLVFVAEGEGKCDALADIGIVATCNPFGAGKWQPEFNEYLRGADVLLLPDNDGPGWRHVNDIGASLTGIAARTRVVLLPGLAEKGDVRDWLAAGGTREALDALAEAAQDWQPPAAQAEKPTDDAKAKAEAAEKTLIDELARLNDIEYDRRRHDAADQLGIRRGTLDDQVNARRAERPEQEGPPPLFGHWVVEPWSDPVDAGELIAALVARIKRHVVVSEDDALTVALWVLFAWVHDHDKAVVHSPILLATSAEANSGKSTLINIVGFLVPRGLTTNEISEATLFRSIEKWQPTILIDEADVLMVDNPSLRSVINSGWTRGQGVLRCVGDDNTPHFFPTFCPKASG